MLDKLDVAIGFATVMLAVSLIIMSLTQAIASALALRGARLRQGLEQLIRHAAPNLKDHAEQLSRAIVTHPLISDSAVRGTHRWCWAKAIKREELMPVLDAVLTAAQEKALTPNERQRLEQWFDSFMDRVSQWFVMNTRWITVVLALFVAFAMHLDSLDVLRHIERDSEVRSRLQAMSATLLDRTPEATASVEAIYRQALTDLLAKDPSRFNDQAALTASDRFTSGADVRGWIERNSPHDAAAPLFAEWQNASQGLLKTSMDASIDRAKTLQADLASTGILAMPSDGHGTWCYTPNSAHFLGMVTSVLFLSLGAPFWFNTLKDLTSLRSVVARKNPQGNAPGADDGGGAARTAMVLTTAAPQEKALPVLPTLPAKQVA